MGKSNRLCANERKLSLLIGEQRSLRERIQAAEKVISELDKMRGRIAAIDAAIELGERWIKLDNPDWSGDHLRLKVPHIHDCPIRFGNGSRLALAIVRESHVPLTVREIVVEACRREATKRSTPPQSTGCAATLASEHPCALAHSSQLWHKVSDG